MREALASWLEARLGRPAEVQSLERISEGHSRAMYRVALAGGERFVLRQEQGGVFGTDSREEFGVMRALHAAGLPVAQVRWHEPDPAVLGQPFFVMDFVEGDPGQPDRATALRFLEVLGRVWDLDWRAAEVPFAAVPTSVEAATAGQVDRWYGVYRSAVALPVPLLEEAAAWLHRHAPGGGRLAVVHGDAGPANFVHARGEVVAVTDWEFCHLGDPAEDVVFCTAMRGHRTMDREGWVAAFRDVLGVELSAEQWRWWEAFNLFKGTCANLTARQVFEAGTTPAPNLLTVGTALHQVFLRRLVDLTATPL